MKVIVRCAGGSNRWGNFHGVPKHLVTLCGEPILHRAVRLTNDVAPDAEVKVVVRDLKDRRFLVPGSSRTVDKPTPENGDVDKIASRSDLWDTTDRTVIMWGDVWWSRPTLTSVLTDPVDDWRAWLRIVGDGGELFAFTFQPEAHNQIRDACEAVAEAHRAGRMRGIPGGWALYRTLTGHDVTEHGDHGHATHVTDWTDDMDTPADWRKWCYRHGTSKRSVREEMTR